MIACACGGILEVVILIPIVSAVTAWATRWYNRYKCRKHHCRHNCDESKKSDKLGSDDSDDCPNFGW